VNGSVYDPPVPAHAGFPAVHLQKIACSTCHIPEVYAAPGRLKYRDWSVGTFKGGFRNMLDWNYDLVTGSHKTVPVLRMWMTKEGEKKIIPVLPSVMPIWVKGTTNTGAESGSDTAAPDSYPIDASLAAPVKHRDTAFAAQNLKAARPDLNIRLNSGNMIPLFDGFSLGDSWVIDTKDDIDSMLSVNPGFASKLKLFFTPFDVTHGVAPKEWALGGSKRGGCVNCHSSADPASPNYSPKSIAFFESYQQPLNNAGMGIGKYDLLKNWFALFADYDCTAMANMMAVDANGAPLPGYPKTDDQYFNPMTGSPDMTDPYLAGCINQMAPGFDAMMGFPSGTAMQMGMFDGIAGLQGFTIRETVDGSTKGCNPFAGPVSFSPVPGQSVNNCMPDAGHDPYGGMLQGTCNGAAPPNPGACSGGFRNGGACMADADCQGALTDSTPLLYSRGEARSHFKIALQQSTGGAPYSVSGSRVTLPISVEKNPDNAGHVNSWDQAQYCVDMMGADVACSDGAYIKTTVNANQFLGFSAEQLAKLMNSATAGVPVPVAKITYTKSGLTVDVSGADSTCPSGNCGYSWTFGDSGSATGVVTPHTYASAGTYTITLSLTDNGNGTGDSASVTVDVAAVNQAPGAAFTSNLVEYGSPAYQTSHTWTVALTDTSTDETPSTLRIAVNWGDGTAQTVKTGAGSLFTHDYAGAGSYTISYKVTDAAGLSSSLSQPVKLVRYKISGKVTQSNGTTAAPSVKLELKQGATVVKTAYTDSSGNYAVTYLKPGTYTIVPAKTGYVFGAVPDATVGPDMTVNITAATP
jgi:hypothetical protein